MASYYVDPATGNDTTGDGSTGTPWATMQKAIDNSTGGDYLNLANTTKDTLTTAITWNTGFGSTSADLPLIIQSWDNGGSITISTPTGFSDLVGGEIDGDDAAATIFSTTSMPTFVTLKNLILHNTTSFVIDPASAWNIVQCDIHSAGATANVDGGTALNIINSYVHDPDGTNVALVEGNGGTGVYVYNTFANPKGTQPNLVGNATYSPYISNLFIGSTADAVNLTSDSQVLISNTFVGESIASAWAVQMTSSAENHIAFGNIFIDWDGASGGAIDYGTGGGITIIGYNHYSNNTVDEANTPVTWVDLANDQSTDPTFTDAAGDNYEVGANAKAKGFPQYFIGTETDQTIDSGASQRVEPAAGGGTTAKQAVAVTY